MNLADELAGIPAARPGKTCSVAWLIGQLDPKDAAALADALNRGASVTAVAGSLARAGVEVTTDALRRHGRTVRGEPNGCKCR